MSEAVHTAAVDILVDEPVQTNTHTEITYTKLLQVCFLDKPRDASHIA